jgi:hypothetical protein
MLCKLKSDIKHKTLSIALATALIGNISAANAAIFDLSFGSGIELVTGTIHLPDGDGTFEATNIFINTPSNWLEYFPSTFDAVNWGALPNNRFTVIGGNIDTLSMNFTADRGFPLPDRNNRASTFLLGNGFGSLVGSIRNLDTFEFLDRQNFAAPVTITPQSISAIPEPSTYAMMGLGLLGVIWARRRQTIV